MKEIKEIIPPVEYKIEKVQVLPDFNSYLLVLSAQRRGVKLVIAEKDEIAPLMNCISSKTVEKMNGKHFIENEMNCTLLEKIKRLGFVSEEG